MFEDNKAVGSSGVFSFSTPEVDFGSTLIGLDSDRPVTPIQQASPDRLAELVHHLSDVPVSAARRAIRLTGPSRHHEDPLSIVAAALIQLRHHSPRCVGV